MAAVCQLVLAMALWPPGVFPLVNSSLENSEAACWTWAEENGILCCTHWLYTSAPFCFMISVSNQSVAGQPVAPPGPGRPCTTAYRRRT